MQFYSKYISRYKIYHCQSYTGLYRSAIYQYQSYIGLQYINLSPIQTLQEKIGFTSKKLGFTSKFTQHIYDQCIYIWSMHIISPVHSFRSKGENPAFRWLCTTKGLQHRSQLHFQEESLPKTLKIISFHRQIARNHQFSPFKSPAYTVKRLEITSFIYIRASRSQRWRESSLHKLSM